jgi:hypothetical protein
MQKMRNTIPLTLVAIASASLIVIAFAMGDGGAASPKRGGCDEHAQFFVRGTGLDCSTSPTPPRYLTDGTDIAGARVCRANGYAYFVRTGAREVYCLMSNVDNEPEAMSVDAVIEEDTFQ